MCYLVVDRPALKRSNSNIQGLILPAPVGADNYIYTPAHLSKYIFTRRIPQWLIAFAAGAHGRRLNLCRGSLV